MRERNIWVWLILGAVILVIMNLPDRATRRIKGGFREGIAPLQAPVTGGIRDLKELIRTARGLSGLAFENQRMSEELVVLRNEALYLKALERENVDLREQLRFMQKSQQVLIPCEFVARDISGWWQTVRLSRGVIDGVAADRAVVTSEGVIGKTIDVSQHTCDVLLLSDPSCKVSAKVSRSQTFGIVSGRGVNMDNELIFKMEFINKKAEVRMGDEVVTSGLGGVFPKGLFIGYIDKVHKAKSGLYQGADIVPKAEFGSLNYAFVIADQKDPVSELLRKKARMRAAKP